MCSDRSRLKSELHYNPASHIPGRRHDNQRAAPHARQTRRAYHTIPHYGTSEFRIHHPQPAARTPCAPPALPLRTTCAHPAYTLRTPCAPCVPRTTPDPQSRSEMKSTKVRVHSHTEWPRRAVWPAGSAACTSGHPRGETRADARTKALPTKLIIHFLADTE